MARIANVRNGWKADVSASISSMSLHVGFSRVGYRSKPQLGDPSYLQTYAAMTPRERFLVWLALVNFGLFLIAVFALDGEAISGKSQDGQYFLGYRGAYTEVSRSVFTYSFFHTLSLFVTHPLAIAAGFMASRRERNSNP